MVKETQVQLDKERYDLAEISAQTTWDIARSGFKKDDARRARSLELLAESAAGLKRYPEAGVFADDALKILQKRLGEKHPRTAELLILRGDIFLAQDKAALAEPFYDRALAIRQALYGSPARPEVAEVILLLADAKAAQKQTAAAQDLYQRVLSIRELAVGAGVPVVARAMIGMAKIHLLEGQRAKAQPMTLGALEIQRTHFGPQHPVIANTLVLLAELHAAAGEMDQAREYAGQALSIRKQAYGLQHPIVLDTLVIVERMESPRAGSRSGGGSDQGIEKVAKSLVSRAEAYEGLKRDDQAEQLYRQALTLFEGQSDSLVKADVLTRYADFLKKEGRPGEAEPLRKQADKIRAAFPTPSP